LSCLIWKESVYFVLTQEGTRELHFNDANLVKLVEAVIVVFLKANFEVLSYKI
jgi:hypothetical protein